MPSVSVKQWYGFRKYIDAESEKDKISSREYMDVTCYKIPSAFFCRALFEMVTDSEPIEWIDGTRMEESYKGSSAFWRELRKDKYYEDYSLRFGEFFFLPDYMKRVHRSRL